MKKQFLNLGKALNKAEQKSINGGRGISCYAGCPVETPYCCDSSWCSKVPCFQQ